MDETLEDEVAEECSKYGQVNRVLIFEVTEPGFPPTEAVRIFIQFDRTEAAVKVRPDISRGVSAPYRHPSASSRRRHLPATEP